MLLDVQSLNTPLTIQGEALEVVEHFTYLGSCISSDCSVTDEVNARICKARAAFANLRHLWRQNGLSLNLKGCLGDLAVSQTLYFLLVAWQLGTERVLQIWQCSEPLASVRGSNPDTAIGYALMMSSNKSKTRVQCFPLRSYKRQLSAVLPTWGGPPPSKVEGPRKPGSHKAKKRTNEWQLLEPPEQDADKSSEDSVKILVHKPPQPFQQTTILTSRLALNTIS
ncbi:hypothetical protein T265_00603 [Opisthorchis viverrini]|uniref:Uncharacterized protein n=1 Tax=Opisthorchis viverrini TaxID=6198 RepID=A0A075A292_OPIVI|nr:hypothetical protein T265_00603 [Opisthorchis viverrini]KER33486.1 hypothetical protein T265_00603 [Opisthorchis viverrini]